MHHLHHQQIGNGISVHVRVQEYAVGSGFAWNGRLLVNVPGVLVGFSWFHESLR